MESQKPRYKDNCMVKSETEAKQLPVQLDWKRVGAPGLKAPLKISRKDELECYVSVDRCVLVRESFFSDKKHVNMERKGYFGNFTI